MFDPLGTEPVRGREELVGSPRVRLAGMPSGESGHLVDEDVRLGCRNHLADRHRVESVHDPPLGAQPLQKLQLGGVRGRCAHLMAPRDECGHQTATDDAASTCHQNAHRQLPSCPVAVGMGTRQRGIL
jgi:hypothetical protein